MTDTAGSGIRLTARRSARYGRVLVAIVLLVAGPVGASAGTAQSATPTEPAFVVALDADGSARVTLTITFDLTEAREREAFEALRENTTGRERRTERFVTRMRAIATSAEDTTDRVMQVRDPAISFATRNDTGVIALSVTWDGLAAREGNELVLREPFASGFTVDREFRIVGPEGYELATVTPSPTNRTRNTAAWSAGATFDGFEATFVPSREGAASGIGANTPGFGIGIAVLALLVSTAMLTFRRQNRH